MKFFLGKDEDEKNDSDSDSEVCTKGTKLKQSGLSLVMTYSLNISLLFQAEGPTVRDLKVRFSTGKKTSKNKKKLEKAMKVLKVKHS